jgi:large subunit ribosomal protein L13
MSQSWIEIDAAGQSVGRIATQVSTLLMGKDEVAYARNRDAGRNIVVLNCAQLRLSERRGSELKYRHSGYLGNLKETKKRDIAPSKLMSEAVRGMMPKNKLSAALLKRLHCVNEQDHPYKGQTNE